MECLADGKADEKERRETFLLDGFFAFFFHSKGRFILSRCRMLPGHLPLFGDHQSTSKCTTYFWVSVCVCTCM